MHPLVPTLACYGMGLALFLPRGGARDPLLSAALALPVGAAASALIAAGLFASGLPVSPLVYGILWMALFAGALWAARGQLRALWPVPAAGAALVALASLAFARIDLAVVGTRAHEVLLAARVVAAGGDAPVGDHLAVSLATPFALLAPARVHAFTPVFALSGVIALAVLLLRALADRRRIAIAIAVALVVASSFPLARSLLTVGSPATAGVFLLVAGGLWTLCELAGDPRLVPIAVVAFAAAALAGGPLAVAALLGLAILAAGTPLSRRAFALRVRLVRAHPALRVSVVAALVLAVSALAGQAAAGALAAAPLALFAVLALAASDNPGRAIDSSGASPIARADLDALVLSWLATGLVAAVVEWSLLLVQAGDAFAGTGQRIRLAALELGNLLPYALVAALVLAAARVASRALRTRRPRLAMAAGAALLSAPYAIWLARYTFSGPQAQAMAHRTLYTVAAAALVAGGFAAAVGFSLLRQSWRRFVLPVIAALVVACAGALAVSRAALQNEYEPLHQFLAVSSLLLAALAGQEIAALAAPRLAPRRHLVPAVAAAGVIASLAGGLVLARDHADAWLVWSETGGSRYLTKRWTFLAPPPDAAAIGERMTVKPALESSRSAALRAERAAARAPNIVIFSIDGLRRDRVGAYGSRRGLTPNIDRFAARGIRFTRAMSSFPLTQVFNSTLLLGRYLDRSGSTQQPPGYRALAISNLLHQRDYHVFVKSWFEMSYRNRFDPRPYGFDTYVRKAGSAEELEEPMEEALARVAAHLDQAAARQRPAFVWMHILSTHPMTGKGFVPHPDFDLGDSRMARYESAVAGTDRWLRGVEELFAARSDRPTIWILCSDHGVNETTLTRDLHDPIVRVPLIIVAPGVPPRTDDHLVDVALDLAATVVDLAGIEPPAGYDGVSLVPLIAGLPADEMQARLVPLSYVGDWTGAIHGRFKFLRRRDVISLYDMESDPGERHNLIGQELERAQAMSAVADRELARRFRDAAAARGDSGP